MGSIALWKLYCTCLNGHVTWLSQAPCMPNTSVLTSNSEWHVHLKFSGDTQRRCRGWTVLWGNELGVFWMGLIAANGQRKGIWQNHVSKGWLYISCWPWIFIYFSSRKLWYKDCRIEPQITGIANWAVSGKRVEWLNWNIFPPPGVYPVTCSP